MAKLLVHESSGVREFELLDAEVHIGRELDNTLRLPDPSISRHHCVLRKVGNSFEIQDLQSSNGVLLNGSRVQSSPLRDGDRITLGQIQMTYINPAAEQGATVAMQIPVPSNPLGTVRMSPEQMAAIHGGASPEAAAPEKQTTGPNAVVPTEAPLPIVPLAPPPAPAPVAPPAPAPRPVSQAPAPVAPSAADPGTAPGFGHFTGYGVPPSGANPAPAFLQGFLPPLPDDAVPTGERGDFGTRLLAALIDSVPMIAIWILSMVLAFVPFVGCIAFPLIGLGALAYMFLFIPWCESTFGGAFGKKIMKLRVVPEDNPTGRIDFGTAILRRVGHMLNCTFGYLLVLGSERKHVGDMISKSICIKVDR